MILDLGMSLLLVNDVSQSSEMYVYLPIVRQNYG